MFGYLILRATGSHDSHVARGRAMQGCKCVNTVLHIWSQKFRKQKIIFNSASASFTFFVVLSSWASYCCRMVCCTTWVEEASQRPNLFTCGFDRFPFIFYLSHEDSIVFLISNHHQGQGRNIFGTDRHIYLAPITHQSYHFTFARQVIGWGVQPREPGDEREGFRWVELPALISLNSEATFESQSHIS